MTDGAATSARFPAMHQMLRLLAAIRFDEVLVLQGAPLMGAILALTSLSFVEVARGALFGLGSFCLVAHVFVINDWAGIDGDLRDPQRAERTFVSLGVDRSAVGGLAVLLMVAALMVFAVLGLVPFLLALAILGLSTFYSMPGIHLKGRPVFGTALHLAGGALHFLLGYVTFAPIDPGSILLGCFFGLIFAAGHLMHETRGYDGDKSNGIRTNAVYFGKMRSFAAATILFTAAYGLLTALALYNQLPPALALVIVLYPVHLYAAFKAWRAGLSVESLLAYQGAYRVLYAIIGVALIMTAALRLGGLVGP